MAPNDTPEPGDFSDDPRGFNFDETNPHAINPERLPPASEDSPPREDDERYMPGDEAFAEAGDPAHYHPEKAINPSATPLPDDIGTFGNPALDPVASYNKRDDIYSSLSSPDDADLASMYVQPDEERVKPKGLTIQDGAPPPEARDLRWLWAVFALLGVCGVVAAVLTLVRLPVVQMDGVALDRPLALWAYDQVTMSAEQRFLQDKTENERAYFVTRRSIAIVYAAADQYATAEGRTPREATELVEAGYLLEEYAVDGWMSVFRVGRSPNGDLVVQSYGEDGANRGGDDVLFVRGEVRAPPEFEAIEAELALLGG